jgi:SAM-dependent methyltransferase
VSEPAPLVSIAMSVRNAERTLGAALASLLAQEHARWELELIDDGSTDGTVALARSFADPRIRVVADGRQRGLAARLNQAVDGARGDFIARMDGDDVAYPERFSRQVAFLLAHPEIDVVAAAAVVFASDGRALGLLAAPPRHEDICARPWAGFYFPHPTWMGRAAWFRRHRYDECATKAQDQALLLRCHMQSRLAALEEPLLGYRQDRVGLNKALAGRWHFVRTAFQNRSPHAVKAAFSHAAKAAVESVAVASGLERALLGHRARPLSGTQAQRWSEVWRAVGGVAANRDAPTVAGFGAEWQRFDRGAGSEEELRGLFERYFAIFPWTALPPQAQGFDAGCGSGRWAKLVAPRVGTLHCFDASVEALSVARRTLSAFRNCRLEAADLAALPLQDASMDFGYSLGVLHHVPDTQGGLAACARKLKPGAPFLVCLYYALDNRPAWFRALWRASELGRRLISAMPFFLRARTTEAIAALVYWPLARAARLAEAAGAAVEGWPLAQYRRQSFYVMRNDALDRFGTRLEQRFTRREIQAMLERAGLERIAFSEGWPYWCAVGYKAEA